MEFQANDNEMKWNKYNKLDEGKFIDLAQRSTVIDDIVNQNMCCIKSKLYFFLPYHLKQGCTTQISWRAKKNFAHT